jgi:antitoxin component of MazEF toxin-antitoxin module
MRATKVIRRGKQLAIVLPADVVSALNISAGDDLIIESRSECLQITRASADLSEELAAGRDIMRRYRNTFKALAKS